MQSGALRCIDSSSLYDDRLAAERQMLHSLLKAPFVHTTISAFRIDDTNDDASCFNCDFEKTSTVSVQCRWPIWMLISRNCFTCSVYLLVLIEHADNIILRVVRHHHGDINIFNLMYNRPRYKITDKLKQQKQSRME